MMETESPIETRNARIEKTSLGWEDHGIFTFTLYLDYGGSGQGAGMLCLSQGHRDGPDTYSPRGLALIAEILKVVGVRSWEDLPGQHIRARSSDEKVHAIGNLLTDNWLDFSTFFKPTSDDQT